MGSIIFECYKLSRYQDPFDGFDNFRMLQKMILHASKPFDTFNDFRTLQSLLLLNASNSIEFWNKGTTITLYRVMVVPLFQNL